jgi:hypothetical protein
MTLSTPSFGAAVIRAPIASGDDQRELSQPDDEIHHAETAHTAPDEIVGDDRADRRQRGGKVVVIPEIGPGQDDEQQADLEKECDPG